MSERNQVGEQVVVDTIRTLSMDAVPVSYTHLTLPTILLV